MIAELAEELRILLPLSSRSRQRRQKRISSSIGPSQLQRDRRRVKLASYSPRSRISLKTTEQKSKKTVIASMRHIFLRDIEDSRLQIMDWLPGSTNKVMAKEIIRALLVLGRRQAINQSQYLPFGYVHHRVAERYQRASGSPFDFSEFRRTLKELANEGIVIEKLKQGRSEKIMLSLNSIPAGAANPDAGKVIQLLNQLKQDALAGRLT